MGFEKLVHEVDAREVARLGLYSRPCTIQGVQQHFDDFGLDAEFGTYGQIKNLSGEDLNFGLFLLEKLFSHVTLFLLLRLA